VTRQKEAALKSIVKHGKGVTVVGKKIAKDKKSKKRDAGGAEQTSAPLPLEELDFPRGGGTSFTPVEVKAIRAEAVKEANEELFKVCRIVRYSQWY